MAGDTVYYGVCTTCGGATTCRNAADCTNPIWHCEEFFTISDMLPDAQTIQPCSDIKPRKPTIADGMIVGGLCFDCQNRNGCLLPVKSSAIVQCEEYR